MSIALVWGCIVDLSAWVTGDQLLFDQCRRRGISDARDLSWGEDGSRSGGASTSGVRKFPMAKKEGVVLDYRTARHESTEILHKRRRTAGCVEVIARVEVAILQVVVGVAMVVVGTALAYDLHSRAGVTPRFGE